ncbi:metallo-beta-lactamase superfamily protein [Diaporthe amygdali]|uniref:metallo-beta-lactamase superfamily protein n=1 Tax=Phomopsis amygdali TaxID=1214568 RepID=UPI0022FEC91F|nr:metallo-beta-lactamase superfamily protein [Diaporthe amygdali]KAJ0115020.1 metallo-beta-lactamase superfamily protein [Diaporthe amygdali]
MALKFASFICPPIPTALPSPDPSSPDTGLWSPLCCTLVYTPTSALIIDCPPSIAATRDLAAWVKGTLPAGSTLKLFLATHAHGDHFFGFPVLEDHFPGIQAVASRYVVKGVESQYAPELYEGLWKVAFPSSPSGTGLPERRVNFKAFPESNEIDLGSGSLVKLHDIPYADTHYSSFVHVPDLGLVVAGDIVYNGDCYQYLVEANNAERRAKWIEAVSQIATLEPEIVIPGHSFHVRTEPDEHYAKAMLESNKTYIRGFEEELQRSSGAKDLFSRMRKRFSRWNLWILSQSSEAAFGADTAHHS